jgi:hypothetical protein
MSNLYDLNSDFRRVIDLAHSIAEEHQGEIPESISAEIDALGMARADKIEQYVRWIKNERAIADMLDSEIDALKKRRDTHRATADYAKRILTATVQPGEKCEYGCGRISWRKSQAVDVLDITALPAEFVKTEITALKLEIKDYLKNGGALTGAVLVDHNSITIK